MNLLPASHNSPGDTDEMLLSRRRVLDGGHYDIYADEIVHRCQSTGAVDVLDVGCGEGFYTGRISSALPDATVTGIDIAKFGVRLAAGAYKRPRFAAASAHALPVHDASIDLLVNVFSPFDPAEVQRVLRPGAILVLAGPGPGHLEQIRTLIYDTAVEHTSIQQSMDLNGFALVEESIRRQTHSLDRDQMMDLLRMTPYWWHAQQHLSKFGDRHIVDSSFEILTFRLD